MAGDGVRILSRDGTYDHMAFRINNKYCAGADEDGTYHILKKDGSFGKPIDVEINGNCVNIQAVERNGGEIDFIV